MPLNLAIHMADVSIDPLDGSDRRLVEQVTVIARRGFVRLYDPTDGRLVDEALFARIDVVDRAEHAVWVVDGSGVEVARWRVVRPESGCVPCRAGRDRLADLRPPVH